MYIFPYSYPFNLTRVCETSFIYMYVFKVIYGSDLYIILGFLYFSSIVTLLSHLNRYMLRHALLTSTISKNQRKGHSGSNERSFRFMAQKKSQTTSYGHRSTPGYAHNFYESLIKYVFLGGGNVF